MWIINHTQGHVKPGKCIYFRKISLLPLGWLRLVPCESNSCIFLLSISGSCQKETENCNSLKGNYSVCSTQAFTGNCCISSIGHAGLAKLWKQHKDKTHVVLLAAKKSCPLTAWRNNESLIFEGTPPMGGGKQPLLLNLNFAFPLDGGCLWVVQRFTSARRISHWVCGYTWLLLLCNKTTFCWFP